MRKPWRLLNEGVGEQEASGVTPRFLALVVTGLTGRVRVPLTGWEHRARRPGLGPAGELSLKHAEFEVLVGPPDGHVQEAVRHENLGAK